MTNEFILDVFDDSMPIAWTCAWLSMSIPVIMALRCLLMRDTTRDRICRVARMSFLGIHAQFMFCVIAVALAAIAYFRRFHFPILSIRSDILSLNIHHFLRPIAVQMAISLVCALVVGYRLGQWPRSWQPRYAVTTICMVACAQAMCWWMFSILMTLW